MAQRVLVNTAAVLSHELPFTPSGVVTVKVERDDGTVLVAAGTATVVDGTRRTVPLTAAQNDQLDILHATWTDAAGSSVVSTHEVAGGLYVPTAGLKALPSLSGYSDHELAEAREWFEEKFERYTGRAFVRRYHRQRAWWDGRFYSVRDSQGVVVRSVSVDGTTLDADALALVKPSGAQLFGLLAQPYAYPAYHGTVEVEVAYEHGRLSTPVDVAEACKAAVQRKLLEGTSGISDTSSYVEVNGVPVPQPTRYRPFGMPSVDEVANAYRPRGGLSSVRIG